MSAIAFLNVARTSPTLPPSAINALVGPLAMRMPIARQHRADILEDFRNRRVWLVHGDLDGAHPRKGGEDRIGNRARCTLQEPVVAVLERRGRGCDHLGIGHRIGQSIGVRGLLQVAKKLEVDDEALSDFRFMLHDAVPGMDHQAGYEDRVGHALSSIAAASRNACTVSATSWVRMIRAPRRAAIRCAAIEPPSRCCGSDGTTEAINRLREAPTRSGKPKLLSSSRRASAVMLCSAVLPKPMPGSRTILPRAMPAFVAMSSERAKKAEMSLMMSIAGSALSRLCMTMTGTLREATRVAMPESPCKPQTSLTITAPASSAKAATDDFMLSIETGTPSETIAESTPRRRASSSSAETGRAP